MAKKSTTKKSTVRKTSKATTRKTSLASSATKKSRSAAKASATTKSKKVTKPKAAAKATAKKSTTKKQVLPAVLQGLRGLHIFSALAYAALIAAVYTLVQVVERTITVGYATSDQLLGSDALAPAVRNITAVDVRHVLALGLALGVVYSLYVATKGWKNYTQQADANSVSSRWVFASLSIAVGGVLVALLHGVYDLTQLVLLAAMLIAAVVVASNVYSVSDSKVRMKLFLVAVILGSVAVLGIAGFILFSMLYGSQTLSLGLYAAADVFALGVLAYALNQYFQLKGSKRLSVARTVEQNYVLISLVTTVALAASVILGLTQ